MNKPPTGMVDGRPRKAILTFTVDSRYAHEREAIVKRIEEAGGKWLGMLTGIDYNYWGEENGHKFIHVYQSEKILSIEAWA